MAPQPRHFIGAVVAACSPSFVLAQLLFKFVGSKRGSDASFSMVEGEELQRQSTDFKLIG
jgi:hypothetical protein